jgi:hypothetical protein
MARATMAALIGQVRALVDDTGGAPVWSDDQVQVFLDETRAEVRYVPLTPLETRTPTGVQYLEYRAAQGWWEDTVTLVSGGYVTLTPATSYLQLGVWTFAVDTLPPVLVSGRCYDVYGAAVSLLMAWLAKLKGEFDFTADGASFRRSQKVAAVQGLIALYQSKMGNGGLTVGEMARGDVNVGGW